MNARTRRPLIPLGLLAAAALLQTACGDSSNASAKPTSQMQNPRDKELMTLARDKEKVATGKEIYAAYCQACHGPEGNDVDSPSNLFDKDWYHGGAPSEIEHTIREGILDKGMPPWGQMISDPEVESAIAYILSFQTSKQ